MAYPKLTPIVATGATKPRYLGDRFADVVNVLDYGAKGDGTTDDTAAFTAALAAGSRVYVPAGTYAVSGDIPLSKCFGLGSLKYSTGREISLNGVMEADSVSQLFLQEINPSTNETFQDICIIDDFIFACRAVTGGVKISKYALNFNVNTTYTISTRAGTQASVEYELPLDSHGEGVHGYKDGNGVIWLYVPWNPDSGSCGFYKVKWSDSSTPTYTTHRVNTLLSTQAQCAVSHDGKYLVFCKSENIENNASLSVYSNKIYVYDRVNIESNGDTAALSTFNVPRTGCIAVRSGLDCDGRYIYLLTSTDIMGDPQSISVYTLEGSPVRSWKVNAWTACYPVDAWFGDGTRYLTDHEAEGICIYKDMLVYYAKAYFAIPASVCKYDGVNFVARAASTGKNPVFEPSYWTPTRAEIDGVSAWDSETSYSAPSSYVHHKFICALAPKGRYSNEHRVNFTSWFSNNDSSLAGYDGLLVSSTSSKDIVLARKTNQTNKVLPRVTFLDNAMRIWQTSCFALSSGIAGRNAMLEKMGDESVFCIRGHGGSASNGPTIYMYPMETMQSSDTYYGGIRCWSGGTETFRALKNSFVFLKDAVPASNNSISLGSSSLKWKDVYCATGAFNGSDRRLKQSIGEVDESVIRAWSKVSFKVFKFIDAVQEKGEEAARLHVGVIAQEIVEAFEAEGLDAFRYGLIGWNSFEDQFEDVEVEDEPAVYDENGLMLSDAKTHFEKTLVSAAHDEYIVRYSEILALECACQRWRADKMQEQIDQLTAAVAQLTAQHNN